MWADGKKKMPLVCREYNDFMGAVDVADSSIHRLANLMKTVKWTCKAYCFLIKLILHNVWKYLQHHQGTHETCFVLY